jgi:exopolysaccharide production protein ExoZ
MAEQSRLDGLQAGRAFAALMVTAFHANSYLLPDVLYAGRDAGSAFNMGYAGVEFFFVLSGFIMILVHARDFDRPERAGRFFLKRILRIYPLYWLILGTLLVVYQLVPALRPVNARDPGAILTSVLLWPVAGVPIMQVAWTLSFELLFYLIFGIIILRQRVGLGIAGLWFALCLVTLLFLTPSWPLSFLLSPYNLLFGFGMIAARSWQKLSVPSARVLLAAGLVVFVATGLSEVVDGIVWSHGWRTVCYGLGAAAMVTGLAAKAIPVDRLSVLLGDASYSIYLVHLPAMGLFVKVAMRFGAPWFMPPGLALAVLVVVGASAGVLVHLWLERPLLRALQRLQAGPAAGRVT